MDEDGYSSSGSTTPEEPPHTAILIVGRSATGKSSLIRNLLLPFARYNKPVYILNDRARSSKRYAHIEWGQVDLLSDAALIIEDIIQATPQQHKILQNLLSYKIHHDRVCPLLGKAFNIL